MSVVSGQQRLHNSRSRLWWRLVVVAFVVYVLVLASDYALLWLPILSPLQFVVVGDILLVAVAGFAAARDIPATTVRRALTGWERVVLIAASLIALLWVAGLLLLRALPDDYVTILRAFVIIPVIPLVALAVIGSLFRRSGRVG